MPFTPGNPHAASGGHARAAKLTPDQRSEIARAGYQATTDAHFAGDADKHNQWLAQAGLAAQDANYPAYMRVWRTAMPHPKQIADAIRETSESNGDINFEDCHPKGKP